METEKLDLKKSPQGLSDDDAIATRKHAIDRKYFPAFTRWTEAWNWCSCLPDAMETPGVLFKPQRRSQNMLILPERAYGWLAPPALLEKFLIFPLSVPLRWPAPPALRFLPCASYTR